MRRCVTHSIPPCWPVVCPPQTWPAVWPAPNCHQLRTDAEPSDPLAQTSSRWTRSLSCFAARNAAPWYCLSSRPLEKPAVARSMWKRPLGSWLLLVILRGPKDGTSPVEGAHGITVCNKALKAVFSEIRPLCKIVYPKKDTRKTHAVCKR